MQNKLKRNKILRRAAIGFGLTAAAATPVALVACGSSESSKPLIANLPYRANDPFIKVYSDRINADLGTDYEMLTGDGTDNQSVQSNLIDTYINRGVKALIVNPVLPTSVGAIIDKAKAKNLPLVLYNREAQAGTTGLDLSVRKTTMSAYDKVAYVGIQAATQGEIQAQMVYDDIKAKRLKDNNGDGKIKYAIIRGQNGHPDAIDRSNAFPKKLLELVTAAPITLVKASDNTTSVTINASNFSSVFVEAGANQWLDWSAIKGKEQAETLINSDTDPLAFDLFVSNNDDMASGVVSTLQAKNKTSFDAANYPTATGITSHVAVYGVDATPNGLKNVQDGWFNGTVLNNNYAQADLINLIVRDMLSASATVKSSYTITDYFSKQDSTFTYVADYKAFYVPSVSVATYLPTWDSFKVNAAA